MSPPTPGHGSSRLAVHACNYSVGQRFTMRVGDARAKWPGWVSRGNGARVRWQIVDNTHADDCLTCKYTGRSAANRSLIGNGGVVELSLTNRFEHSLLSLYDLLAESIAGVPDASNRQGTQYHQIPCKRFRDGTRISTASVSRFTEDSQCPHCSTCLFEGESSTICCYNGKFVLPKGRPNPPELETVLNNPKFPL